ncbi:Inositol oxygenase [Lachnellula occidentalis]|uniref:Inositol oxygenase n=1 Tax=Lachnellula occidentalis TaxID=215460 RepID=A0A8H8UKJ5_9HELO|nr:Inositol oxygenase [Lachnellula occidentalis]
MNTSTKPIDSARRGSCDDSLSFFYPWHSGGAYQEFSDEHDHAMLKAVKAFNPYDLYSKSDNTPKAKQLKV